MDLKQLNTFRTIASLRSFHQAAVVLHYSQSTVSEQIKALESDLDVRLFNRDGRTISLTPAGELLLQYAQKMINLEEEIRAEIKSCTDVYGSLSIRVPETLSTHYMPKVLKEFQHRFPHVDVRLNSCSYYGLYEELRSGIINLAFLITDDFQEPDLDIYTLFEVPLGMVTYPENPILKKSPVKLAELVHEHLFVTSSDCSYFKQLEKISVQEKIRPAALYHINSVAAIKQSIIAGNGVALLPRIAFQKEISQGLLAELTVENMPMKADALMIRLKNKWHPPILEAFMDITKDIAAAHC